MRLETDLSKQVYALAGHRQGVTDFSFTLEKQIFPVRFSATPGATGLVIAFHGASDRAKRTLPAYVAKLPNLGAVDQLSLSDPSMLRSGSFTLSWYAGHDSLRLQTILPGLLDEFIRVRGYERVVFFGSSGGGFAALFYASLMSGSIALVGVPQTNLLTYSKGHLQRYREGCWPDLAPQEDLSQHIHLNLCDWYATPRPNTVVYLQSAGDPVHTRTQFAPFLASIAKVKDARFIANSGYWGTMGHSNAVTPDAYLPWLRACFAAPTTSVEDLLETHYALTSEIPAAVKPHIDATPGELNPTPRDLQIAEKLCAYHLRQPLEG